MTDKQYWAKLHTLYTKEDWVDKPSLFAQKAIQYFPKTGKILELGAGQGQDGRFFADHKYHVVATDIEDSALEICQSKLSAAQKPYISTKHVDLRQGLPFENDSFEVVYAHLSLHYFDRATTQRIFGGISRVLKPHGVLAFLVNSVKDPEYKTGEKLENGYFVVDNAAKRYFSVASAQQFTNPLFGTKILDDKGETYKDIAKGVHNLIRFIGAKRQRPKN